jgi:hypothetical protein
MRMKRKAIKPGSCTMIQSRVTPVWPLLLLAGGLLLMTNACSLLATPSHAAHIQITGLNKQIGEFVIALDTYNDDDMDLRLSDHYALRLDFKWLWDADNDASNMYIKRDTEEFSPTLTPWLTCKYRF